jgi:hypothetical protein
MSPNSTFAQGQDRMSKSLVLFATSALALACTVAFAAPSRSQSTRSLAHPLAEHCRAADDVSKRLAACRDASLSNPNDYQTTWNLAAALIDKGTLSQGADQEQLFREGEVIARKAVDLAPTQAKGHLYLAMAIGKRALFEGGETKVKLAREIKSEADRVLLMNPEEDLAFHVLGVWHREVASLSWALRQFAKLLYGRLPLASMDLALTNLRKAVGLAPAYVPHHVQYAMTLAATQDLVTARQELQTAIALPNTGGTDSYYKTMAQTELTKLTTH